MANNKRKSIPKEDLGEPTLDKQMEDYAAESEEQDDPIFSGKFFNFMNGLLTKRDKAFRIEMVKEVKTLMTEYNSEVKVTIHDLLTAQTKSVGSVVGEVMIAIESLEKKLGQIELSNRTEHDGIITAIADLKTRQDNADEKLKKEELELKLLKTQVADHSKKFETKKIRIDKLEKAIKEREQEILSKIKAIDDEIHGDVPVTVFKSYKIEKWILAMIFAVLVSSLITFFSIRHHAQDVKAAGHNGNIKIENTK